MLIQVDQSSLMPPLSISTTSVGLSCLSPMSSDILINFPDELGTWRPARYRIGKPYLEEYFKHFPISELVEDQDDRIALYSMWGQNVHMMIDVGPLWRF